MKTVRSIKWTEESIEHIARHAVQPSEVDEVCFNEYESPLIRSGRDDLHYAFGATYAGRFLFIVIKFIRRGEVKVITARDRNSWEKGYFRKRGK